MVSEIYKWVLAFWSVATSSSPIEFITLCGFHFYSNPLNQQKGYDHPWIISKPSKGDAPRGINLIDNVYTSIQFEIS